MQEIIKTSKYEIGTEIVNSVNAREIHSYLSVKTRFNDWIQRAIDKYEFKENIDFILLTQKRVSGNNALSKDYIVTLDMAKELAMLENNPKGREIRKYFINLEKQYLQSFKSNYSLNDIKRACIEAVKDEFQETKFIIKDVLSNVIEENRLFLNEAKDVITTKSLTPAQLDNLKIKIEKKAKELSKNKSIRLDIALRTIYGDLNTYFGMKSWYHITQNDFDEACYMVDNISLDRGL